MPRIRVSSANLGRELRKYARTHRRAVNKGLRKAANRGRTHLVKAAKGAGKADTGLFRASFEVRGVKGGRAGHDARQAASYEVANTAPYAGVIELGARPHPVSAEGRAAIAEWVRRKLLGISQTMAEENPDAVDGIVWGIVKKLRTHGQQPTYLFRDALPKLRQLLRAEVERAVAAALGRGGA